MDTGEGQTDRERKPENETVVGASQEAERVDSREEGSRPNASLPPELGSHESQDGPDESAG